eukprot:1408654-Heterocapsa_arctica.AAC.1
MFTQKLRAEGSRGAFWHSSSSGLMRRSALKRGSAIQVVARVVDRKVPQDLSNCDRVRSSSRAP